MGARTQECKNARNSITNVVSLSISKVIPLLVLEIQEDMESVQSVSTAQGNNARMQEKNSGREPVVWVADVRCEGVDCW